MYKLWQSGRGRARVRERGMDWRLPQGKSKSPLSALLARESYPAVNVEGV